MVRIRSYVAFVNTYRMLTIGLSNVSGSMEAVPCHKSIVKGNTYTLLTVSVVLYSIYSGLTRMICSDGVHHIQVLHKSRTSNSICSGWSRGGRWSGDGGDSRDSRDSKDSGDSRGSGGSGGSGSNGNSRGNGGKHWSWFIHVHRVFKRMSVTERKV